MRRRCYNQVSPIPFPHFVRCLSDLLYVHGSSITTHKFIPSIKLVGLSSSRPPYVRYGTWPGSSLGDAGSMLVVSSCPLCSQTHPNRYSAWSATRLN
jgi:hypothetical protein